MAEEQKVEAKTEEKPVEKVEEKQSEEKALELSPMEARASEQGWKPKEVWVAEGGDADEWRDARSFLDRGELLNRISTQNKEMKELRKELKAFAEHNKQLAATKFKEKMESLKEEKMAALEAGDAKRVVELDEQIDTTRDAMAANKADLEASKVAPAAGEIPPEFQRWMDNNSWYGQDAEMREFADQVGTAYAKANRTKSPGEVLKYVEQRVRKAYGEKFSNAKRTEPNTVESGSARVATRKPVADKEADLPPEALEVMNTLVKGGHMTKEEYIKQYNLKKG